MDFAVYVQFFLSHIPTCKSYQGYSRYMALARPDFKAWTSH